MEKLSRHTDEELVKLYVEGLNEAFDTLLIRYKDRLFGYILLMSTTRTSPTTSFKKLFSR